MALGVGWQALIVACDDLLSFWYLLIDTLGWLIVLCTILQEISDNALSKLTSQPNPPSFTTSTWFANLALFTFRLHDGWHSKEEDQSHDTTVKLTSYCKIMINTNSLSSTPKNTVSLHFLSNISCLLFN